MRRLDAFSDSGGDGLLVAPGNSISQSLVSNHDGLAGFKVLVRNPRLGRDGSYEFRLLDTKGQVLRRMEVKESNLGWDDWFRLDIEAIRDSAGNEYVLEIVHLGADDQPEDIEEYNRVVSGESPRATRSDGSSFERLSNINENYLSLVYSRDDTYTKGRVFAGDRSLPGDIQFQSYYQVSGWRYVSDSLMEAGRRLGSDSWFMVVYVGLVVLVAGMFLRRMGKVLRGSV